MKNLSFSVQSQCPLCLRGSGSLRSVHHRDTEDTEIAQRLKVAGCLTVPTGRL